jgi:hypothetical protein
MMNIPETFISQYQAALAMLQQTITLCPDSIWNSPDDKTRFWNIAYHALFYTHFYLQDSAQTFTPWSKHRAEYNNMGGILSEPYDKESLLEYLALCQQQVVERVPQLNLEAASGFDWLRFSKLELLIYNLRHLVQHLGELMERLGTRADVEIDWVGSKPVEPRGM